MADESFYSQWAGTIVSVTLGLGGGLSAAAGLLWHRSRREAELEAMIKANALAIRRLEHTMENTLTSHEGRIGTNENRSHELDRRLIAIETNIGNIDQSLRRIEQWIIRDLSEGRRKDDLA